MTETHETCIDKFWLQENSKMIVRKSANESWLCRSESSGGKISKIY